jgi:hypothetical protein
MQKRKAPHMLRKTFGLLALLAVGGFLCQELHAQSASNNVEDEYKKLIKPGGTIRALGPAPLAKVWASMMEA